MFKTMLIVFKCLHQLAPVALSDLIEIDRVSDLTLKVNYYPLTPYGDRAFTFYGPRYWNALPLNIRLSSPLNKFKSNLKHLIFNDFYDFVNRINTSSHRPIAVFS